MADFNIGIGADYTQLLTDFNQIKSKSMSFFDKMSKDTIVRVHAQLDSKALDTAYAQVREQLKKYNVGKKGNVFNLEGPDLLSKMGIGKLDFSNAAKNMQEIEDRAKSLQKLMELINQKAGSVRIGGSKSDGSEESYLRSLYDGYMKVISAYRTYSGLLSKSFLYKHSMNTMNIIGSYGDDENSLKRKIQLLERLRSEYVKYEKDTGISNQKNIAMIDSEIGSIRKLQDAMSGLGKYTKKNGLLTEKLNFAQQNGDIQRQIQLLMKLRELNIEYYRSTKDIRFSDNAEQYQRKYESLKQYTAQQKIDEANQKKIAAIEEKRDELNRRINNLQGSSKRADLIEKAQLYRQLAAEEQKLFDITKSLSNRDQSDYFRSQAKAMNELAKSMVSYNTIARKEQGIVNLKGGIISNPKTADELNTNIQLLRRIRSLQKDLIQAGKPQDIKSTIAQLDTCEKKLREINRAAKNTNTGFLRQGGILRDLINYAKMYVSIWQAVRLVRNIAETTGEFEKQKAALKAIVQDGASAVKLFNQLKDYSLQTPMTFKDLVTNAKKLTAYQIPFDDLFDTTKRLADLSSGLGVDMNRIILAYGQIRAASVLRGQEVRQLTEAGIPIINELAKAFSNLEGRAVSTAEVFKKISERGVSFEMVKNILWDMTDAGGKFYNMQEKLMDTDIYGPMQKMKDLWTQALDEMGRSASNGGLKKGLDIILDAIKNWRTVFAGIAGLLAGKMLTGIINFVAHFKELVAGLTALKAVTGIIGIISTVAGVLIGRFMNLNAQANKFRNAISEVNTEYGKKANELVNRFNKLVKALNDSAEGSKNEEDALRKLQSAYSEYLPQQDLTIERLRDQKKGYDELTDAILKNIDAQRSAALDEAYRNNLSGVIDTELTKGRRNLNSKWLKEIPGLKSALSEYIYGTISEIPDAAIDYDKIREIYDSFYKEEYRSGSEEHERNKWLSVMEAIDSILEKNNKMIADTEVEKSAFRIGSSLAYSGLDLETLDKLDDIEKRYEKAVEELNKNQDLNDPNNELDRKEVLERSMNNLYMTKRVMPKLSELGLGYDMDEANGIAEQLLDGAKGTIMAEWLKKQMYINGNDIKGEITDAFDKLSPAIQNEVEKILNEIYEKFIDLGAIGYAVNSEIKTFNKAKQTGVDVPYELNWGKQTTIDDYRKKVKDAYSAAITKSKELADVNGEEYKGLQELIKLYERLAKITGITIYDKTIKGEIESKLKKLNLVYSEYMKLTDEMSEQDALSIIKQHSTPSMNEFLNNDTFDYIEELAKIVAEAEERIGKEFAEKINEEGLLLKYKINISRSSDRYDNVFEQIDSEFKNASEAKKYFDYLIEHGVEETKAEQYAKRISNIFNKKNKISDFRKNQFYKYLDKMGVSDNGIKIDNVAGIEKMRSYITENAPQDKIKKLYDILDSLLTDDNKKYNKSSGKSRATSQAEKEINARLGSLQLAYKQYEELKRYMSEDAAFKAMASQMSSPTIRRYFENGTFDYDAELKKLVSEAISRVSQEFADSVNERGERKEQINEELLFLKNFKKDIEAIDRAFANSTNAREYFKQLMEAGLSWGEAVKYANEIDATFDMSKKASTLLISQFYDYLERMNVSGGGFTIDNVAGIRQMRDYIRENGPVDMRDKLLDILEKLLSELQKENEEIKKVDDSKYSVGGMIERRKQANENLTEAIKSGDIASIMSALNKAYSYSDRSTMFNGSKTDIGLDAIKEAMSQGSIDAARLIADTMPFGDAIRKEIDEYNKNGDKNTFDKNTGLYRFIGNIGEHTTETSNVADAMQSIVEDIDSTVEALGGDVDRNDAFHTALNAFTGMTSGISGVLQSALNLDIAGMLKGVVSIFTNPIKAIAQAGDNSIQDDIDELSEHIRDLDNSISNIQREAALLAGSDAWSKTAEEYDKMQQKLSDYSERLSLEQSKKNVDDDAVSEYQQSITDMELQLKEFNRSIRDELLSTVDDWSSRLGNALRDAFENGKNAARSWKEAVDDMIKDIVWQLVATKLLQPVIDEWIESIEKDAEKLYSGNKSSWYLDGEKIDANLSDDTVSWLKKHGLNVEKKGYDSKQDAYYDLLTGDGYISDKVDELKDSYGSIYDKIAAIMDSIGLSSSSTASSSNTLQSMTEDTANRLEAIWNTHLSYVVSIDSNVSSIFANTNGIKNELATVNKTIDAMKANQVTMLDYFNGWANGTRYVQVRMQ